MVARPLAHRYGAVQPQRLDMLPRRLDVLHIRIQALDRVVVAGPQGRRKLSIAAPNVDDEAALDAGSG